MEGGSGPTLPSRYFGNLNVVHWIFSLQKDYLIF